MKLVHLSVLGFAVFLFVGTGQAQPQTNTITSPNFQYFINGGASADPTVNRLSLSQDGAAARSQGPLHFCPENNFVAVIPEQNPGDAHHK
jgi:hypothetical protein